MLIESVSFKCLLFIIILDNLSSGYLHNIEKDLNVTIRPYRQMTVYSNDYKINIDAGSKSINYFKLIFLVDSFQFTHKLLLS